LQISAQPEDGSAKSAESKAAHDEASLEVTILSNEMSKQALAMCLIDRDLTHVFLFAVILLFIVRLVTFIYNVALQLWTIIHS